MKSPEVSTHQPLVKAIDYMLLCVQRQSIPHFIAPRATYDEMSAGALPAHVTLTPRKLGPRTLTRSSQHTNHRQAIIAHYPQDGVEELVYSMIAFVLSGQADLRIGDYVLHCRTGDMIVFPPGIPKPNSHLPHLEGDVTGRSCDLLWIGPSLYVDGIRIFICHSQETLHLSTQTDEECMLRGTLLKNLLEALALESQENGATKIFRQLLDTLLCLAAHDLATNKAISSHAYNRSPEATVGRHPIDFACDYINANLDKHLTLAEVAQHCYLSPSAFTRRFRDHTGSSFLEYLTAQRMNKARILLEETDWNIATVSYYVGLKTSRFRQLFTQHYGQSPVNFRKARII